MALAAHLPIAAGGSFLITPNVGLMVWVLVVFFISFFVLRKWVYPSIVAVLDSRAKTSDRGDAGARGAGAGQGQPRPDARADPP
jgi:hypothetical protein